MRLIFNSLELFKKPGYVILSAGVAGLVLLTSI